MGWVLNRRGFLKTTAWGVVAALSSLESLARKGVPFSEFNDEFLTPEERLKQGYSIVVGYNYITCQEKPSWKVGYAVLDDKIISGENVFELLHAACYTSAPEFEARREEIELGIKPRIKVDVTIPRDFKYKEINNMFKIFPRLRLPSTKEEFIEQSRYGNALYQAFIKSGGSASKDAMVIDDLIKEEFIAIKRLKELSDLNVQGLGIYVQPLNLTKKVADMGENVRLYANVNVDARNKVPSYIGGREVNFDVMIPESDFIALLNNTWYQSYTVDEACKALQSDFQNPNNPSIHHFMLNLFEHAILIGMLPQSKRMERGIGSREELCDLKIFASSTEGDGRPKFGRGFIYNTIISRMGK